jgi:hypothetical protein
MPTKARVIPTTYKGYRFRSRLEARWAVFFDTLGVQWEYEKEGYDLGPAGPYLPDFWLPDLQCFVEVKGATPTIGEASLCRALHAATGWPVVLVHGEVGVGPWLCFAFDVGHSSGGPSQWQVYWFKCDCGQPKLSWGDGCHHIVNAENFDSLSSWCGWNEAYKADTCGPEFPVWMAISSTSKAVEKARGARFEYGEHG